MLRCKVFYNTSLDSVESAVNKFLENNKKIKVIDILQSQSFDSDSSTTWTNYTITIFFKS
jgi:hypothetical protein